MKAVLVRVGEDPAVVDLRDDQKAAFAKMQSVVDGWLVQTTMVSPVNDTMFHVYCDEEGLPKHLPMNRRGIVGPFFVLGWNRRMLIGLTDEEVTEALMFFAKEGG